MGNQKLEEVFNFQKDRKFNFFLLSGCYFYSRFFFVIIDKDVLNENINSFLMKKSLKDVLNSRRDNPEEKHDFLIATG